MYTDECGKEFLKKRFGLDVDNPPEGPVCDDLDLTQFFCPVHPEQEGEERNEAIA